MQDRPRIDPVTLAIGRTIDRASRTIDPAIVLLWLIGLSPWLVVVWWFRWFR